MLCLTCPARKNKSPVYGCRWTIGAALYCAAWQAIYAVDVYGWWTER